jgi:membrane associated rhomboid family serine protease
VRRYPASTYSYSFGPGPLTPAVKALIIANVVVFLATTFLPIVTVILGLSPEIVFGRFWVWQPVTYMFVHGGLLHLLFNMLALWLFGVELERYWGTHAFARYYFVTGVGAGLTLLVLSLLPAAFAEVMYRSITVGASGSIYGLLLAYALRFPDRPILMFFLFPVPAKFFVMIIGAIAFYLSVVDTRGGIAHVAHLGGLVIGYFYLKGGSGGPSSEIKYRYLKWKMNRLKKKFDVYSGGRRDWDGRIH